MNLNDVARGGTMALGCAGLAVDANGTTDAETLADFPYAINGKTYTLTSGDGDVKFDGFTVTAGYTALFLVQVNAAGTITVLKSNEAKNADFAAGDDVLHWPELTANNCPIGAVKIVATAVFTGGTTALGTGNTATYYNLMTVPNVPMTYDND